MGRLDGKAAIITGGEGSIGMATARAFVAEGARVLLAGISEPGPEGGRGRAGRAGRLDGDRCHRLGSGESGGGGRRGAIRPAGRGRRQRGHRRGDRADRRLPGGRLRPDPRGPRARRLPALQARGAAPDRGASIIITSSVVGLTAAPHIAGYSTAKHAQVGLMRTLAAELAPRAIRVNTIHPGPVDNEFQHRVEEAATGADRAAARDHLRRDDPARQARRPRRDRAAPWSSSPATTARS